MSDAQARAVIEQLWRQFEPLVHERLAAIDALVGDLAAGGQPGPETVTAARFAAHNLAGALGTYGRHEAGAIAREIQHQLDAGALRHDSLAILASNLKEAMSHE